ncbi:MAG: hypothetical protein A2068_01620 [Ignavibacteria bacterium GWB2_35_6b]|nr:MAG: hypothetical protein A2068_01620 [Ignavibacteria bacterium GWB2_35_6b]
MKKLKLNLDEIKVESFNTFPIKNTQKGTVNGNGPTEPVGCEYSLDGPPTCWNSCDCTTPTLVCGYATCDEITCNNLSCYATCGCPPDTKYPCD